jgi:hypothetical protein
MENGNDKKDVVVFFSIFPNYLDGAKSDYERVVFEFN